MSQIRFNIGVPRSGSAARSAEDGAEPRTVSMRPQGGSAARAAEERNRIEGVPVRRNVSIGLRAEGGATINSPVDETCHASTATVTRHAPIFATPDTSEGTPPSAAPLPAETKIEEQASSGSSPHTVTARIQSLARSLFHPGGSASKPN